MFRHIYPSIILFLFFFALTGFGYPFFMLSAGESLFPYQASGSLIQNQDKIIGSELIGQNFSSDKYFHSRPSAAGNGYDASNSSGSNLSPASPEFIKAVENRANELKKTGASSQIPVDLVTTSASGLDPDISPASAEYQAVRIATVRQINVMKIQELIKQSTTAPAFGILGDNHVNVAKLNLALDHLSNSGASAP